MKKKNKVHMSKFDLAKANSEQRLENIKNRFMKNYKWLYKNEQGSDSKSSCSNRADSKDFSADTRSQNDDSTSSSKPYNKQRNSQKSTHSYKGPKSNSDPISPG